MPYTLVYAIPLDMKKFPQPPTSTPQGNRAPQTADIPMTDLKVLAIPDDVEFILRTTLKPQHYSDPHITRWIYSYVRCRDISQSAKEAGITSDTARLLRHRGDISEAIGKITELSALKHGLDSDEIVSKVKEVMDVDPGLFMREDGTYIESLTEIPPESRRAIKKFKAKNLYDTDANGMRIVIGKLIEVEFWDKLRSAEMLGREKNLFKETKRIEHDVTTNMKELLLASKDRAEEQARLARTEQQPIEIEYKEIKDEKS